MHELLGDSSVLVPHVGKLVLHWDVFGYAHAHASCQISLESEEFFVNCYDFFSPQVERF